MTKAEKIPSAVNKPKLRIAVVSNVSNERKESAAMLAAMIITGPTFATERSTARR